MQSNTNTTSPHRNVWDAHLIASALGLFSVLGVLLVIGCGGDGSSEQDGAAQEATTATPVTEASASSNAAERGRYLVTAMGCSDCHTPWTMGPNGPAPDMTRMLSGHPENLQMPAPPQLGDSPWQWIGAATNTAYAGPWGVSYAINLTPDQETGIGSWTEDIFVSALKTGKHLGLAEGRPIMPPMPWPAYGQLTDEDLKAIFAYLQSIPPIRNRAPEYQPPAGAPGSQPAAGAETR